MQSPRSLTAREIARLVGGEVEGPPDITLAGIAPLDGARPGDLSFLASTRYLPYFQHTSAGAVLLTPELRHVGGGPATRIVVANPRAALKAVVSSMFPAAGAAWGIHPTARIGRGGRWEARIAVAARAFIGEDVNLGADCIIETGAVIGAGSRLGHRCRIGAFATVEQGSVLGHDVTLKPGARVGGTGFGFLRDAGELATMPHVGRCVLGDSVEIGANATVDRGVLGDTTIGAGTKVDNLVHIGHNVRVGKGCVIMAQVGIAGSTVVADEVLIAGQAGLADHLAVGAGARIAAQSGVIGDIDPGATVSGYPARNHRDVLRQAAALRRLAPIADRLVKLVDRFDA